SSSLMRSMSATEMMTSPLSTTPLSRTRLIKSLRTSGSSAPDKVIRRPGAGELEPKSQRLELMDEVGELRLKSLRCVAAHEIGGVQDRRGSRLGRCFGDGAER